MENQGIFIAEQMASTKLVSKLRSARFDKDIENGSIAILGELIANGEGIELYEGKAPADSKSDIYLVDGVELDANQETIKGLHHFVNKAGREVRLRKPTSGDIFSVSASMVSGSAVKKGDFVEAKAANKLAKVATTTADARHEIKVLLEWNFEGIPMLRLEVL